MKAKSAIFFKQRFTFVWSLYELRFSDLIDQRIDYSIPYVGACGFFVRSHDDNLK